MGKATANKVAAVVAVGTILSETSFYVVKRLEPGKVIVNDDFGNEITIGQPYVEQLLVSADHYASEEKKTMTELAEIFKASARIAMTVAYITKDTPKTKKDYEAEKSSKIDQIQRASLSTAAGLLESLIDNPISKVIPGKLRIMKGRHYGNMDDLGRVHFIDMEINRDTTKDYDTRSRQVDPRTIQYLVINKVKYILK